jgi:hypothetical protein
MALPLESLLQPGDQIRLNQRAHSWTRGRVFTVAEVKTWGVVCWTAGTVGIDAHVVQQGPHRGQAGYHAPWAQIDGPVRCAPPGDYDARN